MRHCLNVMTFDDICMYVHVHVLIAVVTAHARTQLTDGRSASWRCWTTTACARRRSSPTRRATWSSSVATSTTARWPRSSARSTRRNSTSSTAARSSGQQHVTCTYTVYEYVWRVQVYVQYMTLYGLSCHWVIKATFYYYCTVYECAYIF